jgi:hypothetical protein
MSATVILICTALANLSLPDGVSVKNGDEFPWQWDDALLEELKASGRIASVSISGIKSDPNEVAKLLKGVETDKATITALRVREDELEAECKELNAVLNSVADELQVETPGEFLTAIQSLKAWAPASGVGLAPGVKFEGLVAIKGGKLTITVEAPGDLADGEKVEIYRPLTPADAPATDANTGE